MEQACANRKIGRSEVTRGEIAGAVPVNQLVPTQRTGVGKVERPCAASAFGEISTSRNDDQILCAGSKNRIRQRNGSGAKLELPIIPSVPNDVVVESEGADTVARGHGT